jgi:transposase
VPDNTKVAVIKACLYEPQVNRTYAEMPAHYDTAILPARPRRPHDKAKVEVAVLIIERWLLGRPRDCRFYSLAELNATIGELLRQLNDERPIRRLGVTGRALFEELESSATENEIASERAVAKTTNVAVFTRKRPALQPFPSICRASG